MIRRVVWIRPEKDMGDVVPLFKKNFIISGHVKKAALQITALGTYVARLNGRRIGKFVLAPGFTTFDHRLQVQTYDVTNLICNQKNQLSVLVGKGWYRSRLVGWQSSEKQNMYRKNPAGLTAELRLDYDDGTTEYIASDESWTVEESQIRFSEIYDGEIADGTFCPSVRKQAVVFDGPTETLIPQEGEEVREQEHVSVKRIFVTPKGETVFDFGQEVTGYVETQVTAESGEVVDLSFAEVMDKEGNFYTENYRSAKAQYHYTCSEGEQTWKPQLTFFGFRYIRINAFPGGVKNAVADNFTAIQINSDMRRTGWIRTSDPMLNRLFRNIIWGQKCNFVDAPTDCPQRDERLGWTGDAQVFCRTACYNFDTERFYKKWLGDLKADQRSDGAVGFVIPDLLQAEKPSAAWGDAGVICPWEVYMAFGNPDILRKQFESMHLWVDYITSATTVPGLWAGGEHFGDWLGLDAPSGSYKGSSREEFIATAFYAYSTELVIKAGKVLNEDVTEYENLYQTIADKFRETYTEYQTQTECVLAVQFHLAENPQKTSDQLVDMIHKAGDQLQTGFVGTPYLLHVLSDYGHADLAWTLLLRKEYPSWLYPLSKGATTMWEHWDGIMQNGDFWSADMNSFNHYAYGAVADWMYGTAAGIRPVEEAPGYAQALIAPHPDKRLDWFEATVMTRHGKIVSRWSQEDGRFRFDIETPVISTVVIGNKTRVVQPGRYVLYAADDS
ncbi:MAG: glycoside hydrolase family 78 protein [Eubacterium sp.]|nr:glycoside hydrolase family 78 protein [Eubacterium sp.]